MADQIYVQTSGFYNSVNHDRLYNADDMNQPYKRLVTEGIYPVDDDTLDGFAIVLVSGMNISVTKGGALLAGRWFEQAAAQAITVPDNNSAYDRIDSVILQIDLNDRVGNLVYREGTPAANPQSPDINQVAGVKELRVWDIAVAAGTTVIAAGDLTDYRSSAWCRSLLDDAAINSLDTRVTALESAAIPSGPITNAFVAGSGITLSTKSLNVCGKVVNFRLNGTNSNNSYGFVGIKPEYEPYDGNDFFCWTSSGVTIVSTASATISGVSYKGIAQIPANTSFFVIGTYFLS